MCCAAEERRTGFAALRAVLLIAQVAASMILVVGAGLFVATLAKLYANEVQDAFTAHPVHAAVPQSARARQSNLRRAATSKPAGSGWQPMPGADCRRFLRLMYPGSLSVLRRDR